MTEDVAGAGERAAVDPLTETSLSRENDLAAAVGRIPTGLYIIGWRRDGRRRAMLASWVMQSSFRPLMVTFAMQNSRSTAGWLQTEEGRQAVMTVAVMPEGDKSLLVHFGRKQPIDADPFDGIEMADLGEGILAPKVCAAYLAGRVSGALTTGDHTVFTMEAAVGGLLNGSRAAVHHRRSGMHY
ncbi:MAG: flavin reductase family protein [Planctomycetia bacterium]